MAVQRLCPLCEERALIFESDCNGGTTDIWKCDVCGLVIYIRRVLGEQERLAWKMHRAPGTPLFSAEGDD